MALVFISYRRDDEPYAAQLTYERLSSDLGEGSVYLDTRSGRAAEDFTQRIEEEIRSCDVAVVIIGPAWEADGRLNDPNDILRKELELMIATGVTILPVLIRSRTMPRAEDLPAAVSPLLKQNALRFRHEDAAFDLDAIASAVARSIARVPEPRSLSDFANEPELEQRRLQRELQQRAYARPDDGELQSALGITYLHQRRYREAADCFRAAVRAGQYTPETLYYAAIAAFGGKRPMHSSLAVAEAAREYVRRSIRHGERPAAHRHLLLAAILDDYFIQYGMQGPDERDKHLAAAANAEPDDAEIQELAHHVPAALLLS